MLNFITELWDSNKREIRRLQGMVKNINDLEGEISKCSDDELKDKTRIFKERLASGQSLNDIRDEAFAVVREASRRVLGMRHFDVQLMGGIALHEGKITEMKTGEGKTLVATLPAYLNALTGKGVHIVTVNDYLARRDREWMGDIFEFLGLSVGVILHDMNYEERRIAYHSDITYGTNNEFGFDYLRDNMAISQEQLVQGELNYAIVDEVDSILIDEARTPLIISGEAGESTELYYKFSNLVKRLRPEEDYNVDEKAHAVILTESGVRKSEELLGVQNLYDDVNMELSHHLNQALKAKELMKRDRDYVVKDDQIIIVDEFTGRLMFGRRYSEGLHQAIEAKENVKIQKENQTLASITFQNYFRMYNKLAGMTGTAETEEEEFRKIYTLDVVVIPTNKPMIRTDYPDVVYKTSKAKFDAVVNEIEDLYKTGRPVLVGTISIDKSEMLSELLKKRGIPHNVLNAKYHEKEAEIIARAGQEGAITIATNMAGRGTDIVLGLGVADKGGLHVIGTERHESRRIDNQLRGRAGRQGDPGSSRFYVSMEDDLMRLFGADLVTGVMERLGWEEDQSIEHKYLARAIEGAQKRVEARNFDIRKHVLEYDDVLNQQREVIYSERRKVLTGADMRATIFDMIEKAVDEGLSIYADEKIYPEDWNLHELVTFLKELTHTIRDLDLSELSGLGRNELREFSLTFVKEAYEKREQAVGAEQMRNIERVVLLHAVDTKWMEHLYSMDALREGISLRAYGQRDPLLEYKMEAYDMFQNMIADIQEDVVKFIFRIQLTTDGPRPTAKVRILSAQRPSTFLPEGSAHNSPEGDVSENIEPYRRVDEKVGRNDPCPCGSGKKYKRCCGRNS